MKKQSKSARIRALIEKGLENVEIAKKLQVSLNLVHQVRHAVNKTVKQPKSKLMQAVKDSEPKGKLTQAVKNTKKDLKKSKTKTENFDDAMYLMEKDGITIRPFTQKELKALDDAWVLPDNVNSPPHYNTGSIETITFIEDKDLNYRLGNVVKYVTRAGKKVGSDPVEDLEKARWYLDREINVRKNA